MNSTGRVGCHAARAGRLVAARAIALAAANAWAITGLILVTGVFLRAAPSGPTRLKAVPANLLQIGCAAAGLSILYVRPPVQRRRSFGQASTGSRPRRT